MLDTLEDYPCNINAKLRYNFKHVSSVLMKRKWFSQYSDMTLFRQMSGLVVKLETLDLTPDLNLVMKQFSIFMTCIFILAGMNKTSQGSPVSSSLLIYTTENVSDRVM